MKLKDQVAPLELAIKLKKLGFKQQSLCYYYETEVAGISTTQFAYFNGVLPYHYKQYYSAYTVAELGGILPVHIKVEGIVYDLMSQKFISEFGDRFGVFYKECNTCTTHITIIEKTEAEARAKMLIYIKENNIIEE